MLIAGLVPTSRIGMGNGGTGCFGGVTPDITNGADLLQHVIDLQVADPFKHQASSILKVHLPPGLVSRADTGTVSVLASHECNMRPCQLLD